MENLLVVWQRLSVFVRAAIVFGLICFAGLATFGFFLTQMLGQADSSRSTFDLVPLFVMAGIFIAAFTGQTVLRIFTTHAEQAKIERVEERVRENPDKPQLAWDLAGAKLENYLERNLGQLRSIFWLTAFVMMVGFGFVLYGLLLAYKKPDALPISIVGSASGVIISFIGGSFLLIYRFILTQTRGYVSVLERINAVGMALQVLGTISMDNKELRNQSTAKLASQLVELYSTSYYEDQIDQDANQSSTRQKTPQAHQSNRRRQSKMSPA